MCYNCYIGFLYVLCNLKTYNNMVDMVCNSSFGCVFLYVFIDLMSYLCFRLMVMQTQLFFAHLFSATQAPIGWRNLLSSPPSCAPLRCPALGSAVPATSAHGRRRNGCGPTRGQLEKLQNWVSKMFPKLGFVDKILGAPSFML